MFVSAKIHQALLIQLAEERAKREAAERQVTHQQTMIDFLCARVNQLEAERSTYLKELTKLPIPTPTLTPTPIVAKSDHMLNALGSIFEDMGEEAAKKQGVSWNSDGTVKYS